LEFGFEKIGMRVNKKNSCLLFKVGDSMVYPVDIDEFKRSLVKQTTTPIPTKKAAITKLEHEQHRSMWF